MKTLYLCYFGIREPLVHTQALPYLREISKEGIEVHLLTFEPRWRRWSSEDRRRWRGRLVSQGIQWHARAYHKAPSVPATLYDLIAGTITVWRLVRRHQIDVIHARSHVPMALALIVKWLTGCRVIFDVRGLLAEEYASAGRWAEGSLIYQLVKRLERVGLRHADQVVVLTDRLRRQLIEQGLVDAQRIETIPCCVDLSYPIGVNGAADRSSVHPLEVIYAGSVTGLYQLEEMVRFFAVLRTQQPRTFFRLLTCAPAAGIVEAFRRVGVPREAFAVEAVDPEEVPAYLRRAHLGLSFRRPSAAQIGASPTKIAEYLAAGLPVVSTVGVGDLDTLVEREQIGVLVRAHNERSYQDIARQTLRLLDDPDLRRRCRQVAQDVFDLERVGGARYRRLYQRLARLPVTRRRALFLVPYPRDCAPSQRLKFEQYYATFEREGIAVTVSPFVSPTFWRIVYEPRHWVAKGCWTAVGYLRRAWDFVRAGAFDVVYVHLWALPFGPPWLEEWLARRGIPILYDLDDLIYLPKASRANAFLARWRKKELSIARTMRVAKHVIVCTQHLQRFAKQHNPAVTCISSTIDTDLYYPRRHSAERSAVTIGWSGSHSTSAYLHLLAPVLRALSQRFDIRVLVVGDARFRMEGVRLEARPWRLAHETSDLAEMDIGLYPLPEEEWVLGKSGLKALQYMGMGIPVVASAIGEARRFIHHGENGLLAKTPEEWHECLASLIQDPQRRSVMGLAGRQTVEQGFSVRVTAPSYVHVLRSVMNGLAHG